MTRQAVPLLGTPPNGSPDWADVEPVTPAPDSAPLVCGLQHQSADWARAFRPEGTRDWLLVATLAGEGACRAGSATCSLGRGDLLLYAPGTPQDYGFLHVHGGWTNVWVHFRPRPQWVPWLVWPQLARGVMRLAAAERFHLIEAELRHMVETSRQPVRLRHELTLNSLERVILLCDDVNPLNRAATIDPRIRTALEIVGERLAEPLGVDGLSRAVGLSRSRFTALFTDATTMSPQAYIEFVRLARAAQMLRLSSWPVAQIAEQVGFPNPYYFSTRFRKRFGLPPSTYREQADPTALDAA